MTLPRRRRNRPRGRARLALTGDFPETGESVTEILERVKPVGYDGTTWPGTGWQAAPVWPGAADTGPPGGTFGGGIGAGNYRAVIAALGAGEDEQARSDTEPLRAQPGHTPPAVILAGQQAPWIMTVNPPLAGDPGPTPQALKAAVYIETEVGVLEDEGDLYDTEASDTITRKAARRLRGGRRPWKPSEEHRREVARIFGGDIA